MYGLTGIGQYNEAARKTERKESLNFDVGLLDFLCILNFIGTSLLSQLSNSGIVYFLFEIRNKYYGGIKGTTVIVYIKFYIKLY